MDAIITITMAKMMRGKIIPIGNLNFSSSDTFNGIIVKPEWVVVVVVVEEGKVVSSG